jgi:hypothetical protein
MSINTSKVEGRRNLRFDSFDDIVKEAETLAATKIRCLGNWTFPQILDHLAKSLNTTIDGVNVKPPLVVRIMARLMKRSFLTKTMRAGFPLPERMKPHFLPDEKITVDEGLKRLRAAVARLHNDPRRAPNSVLGQLTPQEHEKLQCRHAELHLGFVVPEKR